MSGLVYDFEAGFDDADDKNAWFGRHIGSTKRVLEVGCATGYVGEYLVRNRGCTLVGVEIVPEAADKARARMAYERVVAGDIVDPAVLCQIRGEAYDFVLFGDVLEHLVDPQRALRAVGELLAPNGRVLVCVPNVVHWSIRVRVLLGRFDYTTHGILDRTHLRFYTPTTVREMVTAAGMRVVSDGGVVWMPSPVNKLPSRIRRSAARAAGRLSPGFFYGQTLLELAPDAHQRA